jgi:DNA-binding NtrC family response regulator
MAGERVLLIDDEVEFVETLAERLEARGLTAETVTSGEQAVEVAKRNFDAVLLDLAMPGMDGIATLRLLREINPKLQIILLTGHATIRQSIQAMKLGAVDVVEKPANLDQLLDKIAEASARKADLVEQGIEDQLAEILKTKGW